VSKGRSYQSKPDFRRKHEETSMAGTAQGNGDARGGTPAQPGSAVRGAGSSADPRCAPGEGSQTLTTRQGHPVQDNQNLRTVGPRGPTTLENYHFLEKITHFDRERTPERVVHARGAGAHGFFEAYGKVGDEPVAPLHACAAVPDMQASARRSSCASPPSFMATTRLRRCAIRAASR